MSKQLDFSFHASAEDATTAAIHKSGKAMKALAYDLWPSLKMDTAYARLRGCLNQERPEKLTADEHIRLAQLTGQFDFVYYCAQECGHSRPEPVEPEDEALQLRRQVLEIGNELKGALARLEQVEHGGTVSSIHGRAQGGGS